MFKTRPSEDVCIMSIKREMWKKAAMMFQVFDQLSSCSIVLIYERKAKC